MVQIIGKCEEQWFKHEVHTNRSEFQGQESVMVGSQSQIGFNGADIFFVEFNLRRKFKCVKT